MHWPAHKCQTSRVHQERLDDKDMEREEKESAQKQLKRSECQDLLRWCRDERRTKGHWGGGWKTSNKQQPPIVLCNWKIGSLLFATIKFIHLFGQMKVLWFNWINLHQCIAMDKDPNLCLVVVYADQARLYSENVMPPSKLRAALQIQRRPIW